MLAASPYPGDSPWNPLGMTDFPTKLPTKLTCGKRSRCGKPHVFRRNCWVNSLHCKRPAILPSMTDIVLNIFFPDTSDFRSLLLDFNLTLSGLRRALLYRSIDRFTSEGDIFQVCSFRRSRHITNLRTGSAWHNHSSTRVRCEFKCGNLEIFPTSVETFRLQATSSRCTPGRIVPVPVRGRSSSYCQNMCAASC